MRGFIEELRYRNVFRVAIAYVVAGWLIAQVVDLAADAFNAPDWVMQMLIVLLLIGLPVALFLAWAYELTPDGVKLARDLPDRIAAVAPVGAVADPGNFTPKAPVPIMHIHGTDDRFNFYEGGESEAKPGHFLLSVNETRDLWLANNLYDDHTWRVYQATGSGNTSVVADRYVSVDGAPYEVWTVYNGGHTWPGGKIRINGTEYGPGEYVPGLFPGQTPMAMISSAFSATNETWNFFKDRSRWIAGDNRLPTIDSYSPVTDPMMDEADPGIISFTLNATDPEDHTLHYTWTVDDTDQGTDDKTFTLDFNFTSAGTYTVNVSVSDGYGTVPGHSWTLEINDVNRVPEITAFTPGNKSVTVSEGDILEFYSIEERQRTL